MSTFQLQFWDAAARQYVPDIEGEHKAIAPVFEVATGARRLVRVDKARPLRPRYTVPRGGTAASKDKDATVRAYLDWCIAHNVAPTFYAETYFRQWWPACMPCQLVPMADFLGPAPDAEPDPDADA
jgi:hypothetical protein